MIDLHIDFETFSSVSLKLAGLYKYIASPDFEVLLMAYSFGAGKVHMVDFTIGEKIPPHVVKALTDSAVRKCAHNATFERLVLQRLGILVPIEEWDCSLIKAAYCGLPLSLDGVSKALDLGDFAKDSHGSALIKLFCIPQKCTKHVKDTRVLSWQMPEEWKLFIAYCIQDVIAEREVSRRLSKYRVPEIEKQLYVLDQLINDLGIEIDLDFAASAIEVGDKAKEVLIERAIVITGLSNPRSVKQLKTWLSEELEEEITSLNKVAIPKILERVAEGPVREVLGIRQQLSKSSLAKYKAMLASANDDNRSRGLFQFYGANRTGRWAGRLIQLQNLPQNHIDNIEAVREVVRSRDYEHVAFMFPDVPSLLSQLIRQAFVAKLGNVFLVADFSAIEARVIAWLANEKWRLDVFNSHGKIYEASASKMFKVPIEQVTKGSDMRQKGKIAELALGFGGAVNALKKMGGESMGLDEFEMKGLVSLWRSENPSIVAMWKAYEQAAIKAIRTRQPTYTNYIVFRYDGKVLEAVLPSGRALSYYDAKLVPNQWGKASIEYGGLNQKTKIWGTANTYGGKIAENVVQAIARDLLACTMLNAYYCGFLPALHVHDELAYERPEQTAKKDLAFILNLMAISPDWAKGLPLGGDGYTTKHYKKD